jgi:transposase-like protein
MRKSRLSVYKQDGLVECFASGLTSRMAVALVGLNKSIGAYFYHRLWFLTSSIAGSATPRSLHTESIISTGLRVLKLREGPYAEV